MNRLNLVEWLREHGYNDIRIVKIRKRYLKMWVDGKIVEVRVKGKLVLVRAYRVDPQLALVVWRFFAIP